jgi:hypothetical protein
MVGGQARQCLVCTDAGDKTFCIDAWWRARRDARQLGQVGRLGRDVIDLLRAPCPGWWRHNKPALITRTT